MKSILLQHKTWAGLGAGSAKCLTDFSSGKRKDPCISRVEQRDSGSEWVCINCSLYNWQPRFCCWVSYFAFGTGESAEIRRWPFSYSPAPLQPEHTPVHFHLLISPKVSKNSSISFWSISFLLSASSFALSAFRIFISTRLCHLRCCPSFECIPLISDCSSLFRCSRLLGRHTL